MLLLFLSAFVSILISSSVEKSLRSGSYILYACLIVGWVDLLRETDFEEFGFVAFRINPIFDVCVKGGIFLVCAYWADCVEGVFGDIRGYPVE